MTQKEKDILLKDLCARVPYGVKYMRYSWDYEADQELPVIETLECVDKDGYINHRRVYTVDDIKPYLFPLSSITIDQWNDLGKFTTNDTTYVGANVDWFNKNHFDYRGLIPMGLAIDATGKNIY